EPGDQRGGGLVADARDARQAVARVAAQRRVVAVAAPGDAVLGGDRLLVHHLQVPDAAGGVQHDHRAAVVHELEQVAVPGDDVDRAACRVPRGQGPDDVVGLVPGDAGAGEAERVQHRVDEGQLRLQRVGGLVAAVL